MAAADHFDLRGACGMLRECYAFYSKGYPSPEGNYTHCFHVADSDAQPVIDGVPIPREAYDIKRELEINFSFCDLDQLKGILCKCFLNLTILGFLITDLLMW